MHTHPPHTSPHLDTHRQVTLVERLGILRRARGSREGHRREGQHRGGPNAGRVVRVSSCVVVCRRGESAGVGTSEVVKRQDAYSRLIKASSVSRSPSLLPAFRTLCTCPHAPTRRDTLKPTISRPAQRCSVRELRDLAEWIIGLHTCSLTSAMQYRGHQRS